MAEKSLKEKIVSCALAATMAMGGIAPAAIATTTIMAATPQVAMAKGITTSWRNTGRPYYTYNYNLSRYKYRKNQVNNNLYRYTNQKQYRYVNGRYQTRTVVIAQGYTGWSGWKDK